MTRIDVHQHIWTEPLLAALAARSEAPLLERVDGEWLLRIPGEPAYGLRPAGDDLGERAAWVERDGLDRALVALSSPLGIEALPAAEAAPLLDAYHEGLGALPDCFGAWGAASLADPDPGWVDQALARGCVGLSLPADALGTQAGLERCAPLLERLAERSAPLMIHPGPAPWSAPVPCPHGTPLWWPALTGYVAGMNAAWHAFLEWGRAAHPALRVVFTMLAGGAPLHAERLGARGGPLDSLDDPWVFYDTSSYGVQGIDAMARRVGVDQLVHGSDRPIVACLPGVPAGALGHALAEANPARLLAGAGARVEVPA